MYQICDITIFNILIFDINILYMLSDILLDI